MKPDSPILQFLTSSNFHLKLALLISFSFILYQHFHAVNRQTCRLKRSSENGLNSDIEYTVRGNQDLEIDTSVYATVNEEGGGGSKNKVITKEGDDYPLYLPLYTKLSNNVLENLCKERFEKTEKVMSDKTYQRKLKETNKTKDKFNKKSSKKLKMMKRKICLPIAAFGQRKLIAKRLHHTGSSFRSGDQWFLTEYQSGYTLFHFNQSTLFDPTKSGSEAEDIDLDTNELNASTKSETEKQQLLLEYPTEIHTLAEPFIGTDHTVFNRNDGLIFYYALASTKAQKSPIEALHIESGRRTTRLLNIDQGHLYSQNGSNFTESNELPTSPIDLEVDLENLWAIYKNPFTTHLTVSKLSQVTLKELKRWELTRIDPLSLVNSFISCGILYAVRPVDQNNFAGDTHQNGVMKSKHFKIAPEFNFNSNSYIDQGSNALNDTFLMNGPISNVQYDPQSDSLTYFNNGKVYSIPIERTNN